MKLFLEFFLATVTGAQIKCGWSKWTDWSKCSIRTKALPCTPVQTRVRRCYGGPACCRGKSSELKSCGVPEPSCLADTCEPWSKCCPTSQTVETGKRSRFCSNLIYQKDPRVPKEEDCQLEGLSDWTEWSSCSVSAGEGIRTRERTVNGCPTTIVDSESCLETVIIKTVGPSSRNTPVQCEISDTLIAQMTLMLNRDCTRFSWSSWTACKNPCSGRRSRFASIISTEPMTVQYEACAQINNCDEVECEGNWGGWSYWQETQPNIQARVRTNECDDNDLDYRHMTPVKSYQAKADSENSDSPKTAPDFNTETSYNLDRQSPMVAKEPALESAPPALSGPPQFTIDENRKLTMTDSNVPIKETVDATVYGPNVDSQIGNQQIPLIPVFIPPPGIAGFEYPESRSGIQPLPFDGNLYNFYQSFQAHNFNQPQNKPSAFYANRPPSFVYPDEKSEAEKSDFVEYKTTILEPLP